MNDPSRRTILIARVAFAATVLALWQAVAAAAGSLFLASPVDVVAATAKYLGNGEFLQYLWPTMKILLGGSAAGIALGVVVGLVIGRYKSLYWLSEAPINIFYTTPLVALIPFLLVILGFGTPTKIFIVFLFALLPTLINTASGVRTVDRDLLELARSFCASEASVWRDVLVPTAIPGIITGIRLGFVHALTGAVLADFYAGASGLGYLIIRQSNRFDVAGALVPVLFLALLGAFSIVVLQRVQRQAAPWQVRR